MKNKTIAELLALYPFLNEFFLQNRLDISGAMKYTLEEYIAQISQEEAEEKAINKETLYEEMTDYIAQVQAFLGIEEEERVRSLTILPGQTKSGEPERFGELTVAASQIVSIVGPTGSGKSRLLADIEWAAQGDTPTKRRILINGAVPDIKWRFSSNNRLVAQLSQNMNFIMDLSVKEFLEMHAQSRMIENADEVIKRIMEVANDLAGERFFPDTPVTGLSGGQSRALMIADTAILSASPIVLIDEIENAGIDRGKALDLLVSEDKIVLMATHDPLLALMADHRIVIQNGGIHEVLETSAQEKELLERLRKTDAAVQNIRQSLRKGKVLSSSDFS